MDEFFLDLALVYREEIAELAEIGCRHVQLDEVNFSFLCDPRLREGVRVLGEDRTNCLTPMPVSSTIPSATGPAT